MLPELDRYLCCLRLGSGSAQGTVVPPGLWSSTRAVVLPATLEIDTERVGMPSLFKTSPMEAATESMRTVGPGAESEVLWPHSHFPVGTLCRPGPSCLVSHIFPLKKYF